MGWAWGRGPFAAVSLLEYDGLQPILPFLGGCSDAACRVVMKTVGFMGGGAWGRGWAGESSRCEDPAPTVGVCGDALARRIAIPMLPLPPPPCACHAAHGEPRFYNRGGMGREGAWGWAGNFRPAPTAPPLPRAQQWQAGLLQEAPQEAEKTLKSQAYKR